MSQGARCQAPIKRFACSRNVIVIYVPAILSLVEHFLTTFDASLVSGYNFTRFDIVFVLWFKVREHVHHLHANGMDSV